MPVSKRGYAYHAKRLGGGRRSIGIQRSRAIHTAAFTTTMVQDQSAPGPSISVDLNQYFSTMLGRNLPQSQTYRVVGLRCRHYFTTSVGDVNRSGFGNDCTWTYVTPTQARVAAWEAIRDEFAAEVVENREWARGRQFYAKYLTTDTAPAWGSKIDRAGTLANASLIGVGSATEIAIFDEYNQAHPKYGDPGTIGGQGSQELFSVYASEIEDAIRMGSGKGFAVTSSVERYAAGVTLATGTVAPMVMRNFNTPAFDEQGSWQARPKNHLAVMCGLMRIQFGTPWPVIAPVPQQDGVTFVPVNNQKLTTMTIVCEADVEGWEPFVKKGV